MWALRPRKKWGQLLLEISSKDGYVTVYDQALSSINSWEKKSCLCSDHKQKASINLFYSQNSKKPSLNYGFLNRFALILINFYRYSLSYFFGGQCKFYPTCSEYALGCYTKFGFLRSTQLVFVRLIKCHPFSKSSGYDPVPFKESIKA